MWSISDDNVGWDEIVTGVMEEEDNFFIFLKNFILFIYLLFVLSGLGSFTLY